MRAAPDQPHAKIVLEFAHVARQRRLGRPAGPARAAEAAMGGDEVEIVQGQQIQGDPFLKRSVSISTTMRRM
jgi:hypothetical protein